MPISGFTGGEMPWLPQPSGYGAPHPGNLPTGATGGVSSGSAPQNSPAHIQQRWQSRVSDARSKGISDKVTRQIYRYDVSQVKAGKSPMSDSQYELSLRSLMSPGGLTVSGSPLVGGKKATPEKLLYGKQDDGGFLGAVSDLRNTVGGLINIPQAASTVGSAAYHDVLGIFGASEKQREMFQKAGVPTAPSPQVPGAKKEFGKAVSGIRQGYKRGGWQDALASVANQPGAQLIPGTEPVSRFIQDPAGYPGYFAQHPFSEGLQLLPWVSEAGKAFGRGAAIAGTPEAEGAARVVGPESITAMLKAGKPLKAIPRLAGETSDLESPLGRHVSDVEKAAGIDKPSMPRSTEIFNQYMNNKLFNAADKYTRENVTRPMAKAGARDLAKVRQVWDEFERTLKQFPRNVRHDMAAEVERQAQSTGIGSRFDWSQPHAQQVYDAIKAYHNLRETVGAWELDKRQALAVPFGGGMQFYGKGSAVEKALKVQSQAKRQVQNAWKGVAKSWNDRMRTIQAMQDRGQVVTDPTPLKTPAAARAEEKLTKARTALAQADEKYNEALRVNAPPAFQPAIHEGAYRQMQLLLGIQLHNDQISMETFNSLMSHLEQRDYRGAGFTKDEFKSFVKEQEQGWQDLWNAGFRPEWTPHVPESSSRVLFDTKPFQDTAHKAAFLGDRSIFQWEPGVMDIQLSATYLETEMLRDAGNAETAKILVNSGAYPRERLIREAQARIEKNPRLKKQFAQRRGLSQLSDRAAAEKLVAQENDAVSTALTGYLDDQSIGHLEHLDDGDVLMIPKGTAQGIHSLMRSYNSGFMGGLAKTTRFYRKAVTAFPRHIAHVNNSSAMFMFLEDGLGPFRYSLDGLRMAFTKNGLEKLHIPITMQGEWQMRGAAGMLDEELVHYGSGRTIARWMHQLGAGADWIKKKEDQVGDFYRAIDGLYNHDKALKMGASDEEAWAYSTHQIDKIFLDFHGMAPIERQLTTFIFPFWSFTRQILRFVLRYPSDHPWRAAFLTRLSQIQQEQNQSGLPRILDSLLPLGTVDPATGKQTVVDTKTLWPFRSLDGQDPFTPAGFFSMLNPLFKIPFEATGGNPLSLTGGFHPELTVDAFTGGTTQVQDPKSWIDAAAHQMFPEYTAVETLLGFNEKLNAAKQASDMDFRQLVSQELGIPFIPFDLNVYRERLTEAQRHEARMNDINKEIAKGDFSRAYEYAKLPVKGYWVPPGAYVNYVKHLEQLKKEDPNFKAPKIPRGGGPQTFPVPDFTDSAPFNPLDASLAGQRGFSGGGGPAKYGILPPAEEKTGALASTLRAPGLPMTDASKGVVKPMEARVGGNTGNVFRDILAGIGAPDTTENERALAAWKQAEGGSVDNPFNTTEAGPGARSINGVGVKRYPSAQIGVDATVRTLLNGQYGGIVSALRSGNSAHAVAQGIANSPWGTGGLVLKIVG